MAVKKSSCRMILSKNKADVRTFFAKLIFIDPSQPEANLYQGIGKFQVAVPHLKEYFLELNEVKPISLIKKLQDLLMLFH
jgi:hypothetical protein